MATTIVTATLASADITLGLLAGGLATRLGGVDKAWLQRDGVAQVLRLSRRFELQVATTVVSANRDHDRYAMHGLHAVGDRVADAGPLAGLEALARVCRTPWLFTLPVDVIDIDESLLASLAVAAGARGAYAVDEDGLQPLLALWPTIGLRDAASNAIARGDLAVQALHGMLAMSPVHVAGARFGNINTPADLAAAGISP